MMPSEKSLVVPVLERVHVKCSGLLFVFYQVKLA